MANKAPTLTNTNISAPTLTLTLSRIRRIIHADDDARPCSAEAVRLIAAATEMFIEYLVQQSFNFTRAESKPRRTVQYRDVANAVARFDNLEFLCDVVPRTMTLKHFKAIEVPALRSYWPKEAIVVHGNGASRDLLIGDTLPTTSTEPPVTARNSVVDVRDVDVPLLS